MPKIVVLGDAHASSRAWPRLEVYGDSFVALREVAGAARSEGATLVATGDLLHSGIAADTPRCLEEIIQATQGLGDIVYAVGNHDRTGAAGGERNPEWVDAVLNRHFTAVDGGCEYAVGDTWWCDECRPIPVRGVRYAVIHHQPSAAAFEEKVRELERRLGGEAVDVLVCHQGMDRTLWYRDAHEIVVGELGPRLAGMGCRLCLCGHYHGAGQWEAGGVAFVSPGALVPPLRGGDGGRPRYPVVDLPESGPPLVEWRDIVNVRTVVDMAATDAAGREAALAALSGLAAAAARSSLPAAIARPVFSLAYVPEPGFRQALEGIAGDAVHLHLSPLALPEARAGEEPSGEDAAGRLLADIERIAAVHLPPGPAREALVAIQRGDSVVDTIERELARLEGGAVA
jgi:predicted phosphodiesterase